MTVGRIPDIKPLSMLYAKAKEMKDKQPEAAFVRLAEFLSTPFLQRFQAQCLECKVSAYLLFAQRSLVNVFCCADPCRIIGENGGGISTAHSELQLS